MPASGSRPGCGRCSTKRAREGALTLRRAAVRTIFGSTLALGTSYGSAFLPGGAPGWAAWLFIVGVACLIVGAMVLGTARPGRGLGRVVIAFAAVWLVVVIGFGAALELRTPDPGHPALWLGLPAGAATVLYGVGLLPMLILPLAYALTFETLTLSDADLERIRAARPDAAP